MTPERPNTRQRRTVVLNVLSNYIGKFVSTGAWFVLTPFILAHLEEEIYGLWVLVGSLVAYGTLLEFGIAGAVTKYVAEYRTRNDGREMSYLVTTAFLLYCFLGLVVVLLSVGLAFVFPLLFNVSAENTTLAFWLVCLAGLGVGISIPCTTTYAILRGLQRFDVMNLIGVVSTLLNISLIVLVLLVDGGALGLVLASLLVTLLMQIPSVWFIRRLAPELGFGWHYLDRRRLRTVVGFSSSLFLINLGGHLEAKTDEVVIGASLPVMAVTPYTLARRLSNLPQMLTDQFLSLLLPMASELDAENDKRGLQRLYLTSTRLTLAVFLSIGVGLIILAAPILTIWVGAEYAQYSYLVAMLVIASLVDTSQWSAGLIMQGIGRHRFLAPIALASGIVNLLLSLVLVTQLELLGVALGTLIPTTFFSLVIVMPYAMGVLNVSASQLLMRVLVPAFVPVAPMILATYFLYGLLPPLALWSILLTGGTGTLVYMIVYLSLPACDFERQLARGMADKSLHLAQMVFRRA